jgi:MOSC domain-containing protein YiiM
MLFGKGQASLRHGAHVVSVNVGSPRLVETKDAAVLTSIFKSPVEGRVPIRGHNLEGDRQSDLTVHGGPYKALYAYASEHYQYWVEQLPAIEFTAGMFGENLTTAGLDESVVRIGDRFGFGSAVLQVTQPRMPCYKLALRFGRADMVKRFWLSGRSGIYFSVVKEGDVAAGDAIEKVADGPEDLTVADVVRLYRGDEESEEMLERALRAPLFGGWKREIVERRAANGAFSGQR